MVAELRDDDLGDQCLGRQATQDHVLGCMGLDPGAGAAAPGVSGATLDQHPQLCRHNVQPLGAVLTTSAANGASRIAKVGTAGFPAPVVDLPERSKQVSFVSVTYSQSGSYQGEQARNSPIQHRPMKTPVSISIS